MKVHPWFYCKCGKLHIATYITEITRCACGEPLLPQIPMVSTNARGDVH